MCVCGPVCVRACVRACACVGVCLWGWRDFKKVESVTF
jgi:hypothetical protein